MSERTDSDGEKENYDDIEPPKQHQKLKLPPSVKGKQRFAEMVSAEEMESLSKGFAMYRSISEARFKNNFSTN